MIFCRRAEVISILAFLEVSMISGTTAAANNDDNICSLYLAPSTIPGAGYGIFTTEDVAEMAEFFGENIAVPLVDLSLYDPTHSLIFTEYYWSGSTEHQKYEALELDVIEFNPLGTLGNHHSKLKNLILRPGIHDDTVANRLVDSEAGAFTYHGGERYFAKHAISAGSELFNNYGDGWWEDRMLKFNQNSAAGEGVNENQSQEQHSVTLVDTTCASAAETDQAKQLITDEGKCPVEWIKANGVCIDNIILGRTSTILDSKAGRGAFAKRFLKAGSLIAPIPLLHVMDKDIFNLYPWHVPNGDGERRLLKDQGVIGQQLLLNYCFGHPQSSLLLCQAASAALVNHNRDQPNARVQWSDWDSTTKSWLSLSFDELAKKRGRGLMFDLIAIRDINEGEEIFIDYGNDWQISWNQHKESWAPPSSSEFFSYEQTDRLNKEAKSSSIRTTKEQITNPYPSNIMTVCLYNYDDEGEESSGSNKEASLDTKTDEDLIKQYSKSGGHFVPDYPPMHEEFFPCIIYSRHHESGTCTVRIFRDVYDLDALEDEAGIPTILTEYPENSIRFVNRPYMGDIFLAQGFRHSLGIPNEMFPEQWKNLKEHTNTI